MSSPERSQINFSGYLRNLAIVVFSSTLILALMLGIALLIAGETSVNGDLDFDLTALDGLLVMMGLPILSVLFFVLLSPLSYFIYKIILRRRRHS